MNDDMNLAAWMVAGGPTRTTFADEGTRSHIRALAAGPGRLGIADRLGELLGALRPVARTSDVGSGPGLDAACCAA